MKAVKHDAGKPRMDLIPPEAMKAMGATLAHGAERYGERNWEQGLEPRRLAAAMLRHYCEWATGKANDEESGLPHLWHMLTNAAMLVALDERNNQTKEMLK